MVEMKLFKTKLCVLYQKGRCHRQNCSFAHGNAELRQSMPYRDGKQEYQGGNLRDRLDQRLSPQRQYSPGQDANRRRSFHAACVSGSSPSSSLEKSNDRKRRKKQQYDGQNDLSGSLKVSDGADDQFKERKSASSELKEMQSNINKLEHRKSELMILLEKKAEEADSFTSRIQELEAQLSAEKDECKRITSKINKFVKAYKRYVWAQDELKRSEVRFQKLGDQLVSGSASDCYEEDSNINIVNDGETDGHHAISTQNETQKQNKYSPIEKALGGKQHTTEKSTRGNLTNGGGHKAERLRPSKPSQFHSHPSQLNSNKEFEVVDSRNGSHWPVGNEGRQKKGKSVSTSIPSDKAKGSGSVLHVPSTSMAARATDELVETEMEESVEVVENISLGILRGGATYKARSLTSPPPPIPRNSYSKYVSEDEYADVGGLEEEIA